MNEIEIKDDTILEVLRYQKYERTGESHKIANREAKAIIEYIFGHCEIKDGIKLHTWYGDSTIKGIQISFYDFFCERTRYRTFEFKGKAIDYKTKVLGKFEVLKKQKEEADGKDYIRKLEEKARQFEIAELETMTRLKFEPLEITSRIEEAHGQYQLKLIKYFANKQNLIEYIHNFKF